MYDHCSVILLRLEWKFGTVRSGQNDQKCSQKLREKKHRTIFKVGPSYVIHNNIQLNYVGVYSVHMKDQETLMLEPAGRNTITNL